MEQPHKTSPKHAVQSTNFPPFYPEQTTQASHLGGSHLYYQHELANSDQAAVEFLPRTGNEVKINESFGREIWTRGNPSSYAATAPLFVRTSPLPWEPLDAQGASPYTTRRRVIGFSFPEESAQRIPLQDPPKSKKRQLSEETSTPVTTSAASYSAYALPSPRNTFNTPKTPQPETANNVFVFQEHFENMSPKRIKMGPIISRPMPSQLTVPHLEDTDKSPKRLKSDQGNSWSLGQMQAGYPDEIDGCQSPKRVKSDVLQTCPPRSPLCQSARCFPSRQQTISNDQELFFRYPDVIYPDSLPNVADTRYQSTTSRDQRFAGQRFLGRIVSEGVEIPSEGSPLGRDYFCDKYAYLSNLQATKRISPLGRNGHTGISPDREFKFQRMNSFSRPKTCQGVSLGPCPCEGCRCPVTYSRHPRRSQSNIDNSPSKKELEEMEQEKFARSVSKPEGHHDFHLLQKQLLFRSKQAAGHYILEESPHEVPMCRNFDSMPITSQDSWNRNACRQLFSGENAWAREHAMNPCLAQSESSPHLEEPRRGVLCHSCDDYNYYIIPEDDGSDRRSSLPDLSSNENEALYLHHRRQTISCARDAHSPFSPMRGGCSPEKRTAKGVVNVRMSCQDVAKDTQELAQKLRTPSKPTSPCTCERVEREILNIAKNAYARTRRENASKESFERYQKECQETNVLLKEAMATAKALKKLCGRHGKIQDVFSGSVVIAIQCSTLASLEKLRELYKSGELKQFLSRTFVTDRLKVKFRIEHVLLSVFIDDRDFQRCQHELMSSLLSCGERKKTIVIPKLSPLKRETKSAENLENIPSLPQSPVHMRSTSTPVLTASPVSSPSFNVRSPTTPTRRDRIFSFSMVERRSKTHSPTPFRERKHSLSSSGDISPRSFHQARPIEESPKSPSKTFRGSQADSLQSSPRLRNSLEDITSDMSNVSFKR